MLKLWNVALTGVLLCAACFAWIASTYDGYCYGFTDGQTPCSFADYFDDNLGWASFLFIFYFPHFFIVGLLIYLVNDAVYRAVVQRRARRWLAKASDELEPTRRPCGSAHHS